MSFPILVNGNTWNAADFQDGKVQLNLGKFLNDCLVDFKKKFEGTSVTSQSLGSGAKAWTTQTGRLFNIGQRVIVTVVDSLGLADHRTGFMTGIITGYNSGTGLLNVTVDYFSGSGSYSNWSIGLGGDMFAAPTTVVTSYGGTGQTNADAAREAMGVGFQVLTMSVIAEDFTGYIPVFDSSTANQAQGMHLTLTGAARAYGGGNVVGQLTRSDSKKGVTDGSHPGILVLEVRNVGDVAEVRLSQHVQTCLTVSTQKRFKTLFYVEKLNSLADMVTLDFGFKEAGASNSNPGIGGHLAGLSEYFTGNTLDAGGTTTGSVKVKAGTWYEATVSNSGSWGCTIHEYVSGVGLVQVMNLSSSPSAYTLANAMIPFLSITKVAGGVPRKLMVDYLFWEKATVRP